MDSSALRKTNLGMVGSIRWLVDAKAITTHFQPIFSVPQRAVVGMEALACRARSKICAGGAPSGGSPV
jgi:EAL domain-containing protein (putative c-di-GMP-specific phosphodiesterase class I)